jgi:hypothetical protein
MNVTVFRHERDVVPNFRGQKNANGAGAAFFVSGCGGMASKVYIDFTVHFGWLNVENWVVSQKHGHRCRLVRRKLTSMVPVAFSHGSATFFAVVEFTFQARIGDGHVTIVSDPRDRTAYTCP